MIQKLLNVEKVYFYIFSNEVNVAMAFNKILIIEPNLKKPELFWNQPILGQQVLILNYLFVAFLILFSSLTTNV